MAKLDEVIEDMRLVMSAERHKKTEGNMDVPSIIIWKGTCVFIYKQMRDEMKHKLINGYEHHKRTF